MEKSLLELLENEKEFAVELNNAKAIMGKIEKAKEQCKIVAIEDYMQFKDLSAWNFYVREVLESKNYTATEEKYNDYCKYLVQMLEETRIEIAKYFGMIVSHMHSNS